MFMVNWPLSVISILRHTLHFQIHISLILSISLSFAPLHRTAHSSHLVMFSRPKSRTIQSFFSFFLLSIQCFIPASIHRLIVNQCAGIVNSLFVYDWMRMAKVLKMIMVDFNCVLFLRWWFSSLVAVHPLKVK